jgi:hypothetical protein
MQGRAHCAQQLGFGDCQSLIVTDRSDERLDQLFLRDRQQTIELAERHIELRRPILSTRIRGTFTRQQQ